MAYGGKLKYSFHSDGNEFEIGHDKKPAPKHDKKGIKAAFKDLCSWVIHTVQGDFNKDQEISHIATNSILGLIPVVDQVLDVRDILAPFF